MKWYLKCLKQYADFKGRARREEFWYFMLFNIIVSAILLCVSYYIIGAEALLQKLYAVAVFIPMWAVTSRRIHDAGWSSSIVHIVYVLHLVILYVLGYLLIYNYGDWDIKAIRQLWFKPSFELTDFAIKKTYGNFTYAFLVFLVPYVICSLIVLFVSITKGEEVANKYGEDPKKVKVPDNKQVTSSKDLLLSDKKYKENFQKAVDEEVKKRMQAFVAHLEKQGYKKSDS